MTEDRLRVKGKTLKDQNLPDGVRVLMIKREGKFIVPTGTLELKEGDRLLVISVASEHENPQETTAKKLLL